MYTERKRKRERVGRGEEGRKRAVCASGGRRVFGVEAREKRKRAKGSVQGGGPRGREGERKEEAKEA